MTPTSLLTEVAHGVSRESSPTAVRVRSAGARTLLRVLAIPLGGLILIISLVDPHGGGPFVLHTAALDQEGRHG